MRQVLCTFGYKTILTQIFPTYQWKVKCVNGSKNVLRSHIIIIIIISNDNDDDDDNDNNNNNILWLVLPIKRHWLTIHSILFLLTEFRIHI